MQRLGWGWFAAFPLVFVLVASGAYAFPCDSSEPSVCLPLVRTSSDSTYRLVGGYEVLAGQINVTGRVVYADYYGGKKPLRYVPINIYDYNDFSFNELLGSTTTDWNGSFSAGPFANDDSENGTADVMVMVWSLGPVAEVRTDNLGLPYSGYSDVHRDVPDGVVDMGELGPPNISSPWSVYDAAMEAWHYLNDSFGFAAPLVKLRWPDMTWIIFTVQHGAYYVDGGDIFVGLDAATSPDVIMHEYGHFVMREAYGGWLPDRPNCTGHSFYTRSSAGCAWTEGWANFFPLAVSGNSTFEYLGNYTVDLEPREPYGDTGDETEGRVAAALYDIYDNSSDGYENISDGFGRIWSIVSSNRSDNLSGFWKEWKSRGYDNRRGLDALFQNTIDYCTDADGDRFREMPCGGDCNDTAFGINPNESESCNLIDDNCNGRIDEGFDNDGDGFTSCGGDCDDNNAALNPSVTELCNGIDDNCNGEADEVCEKAACGAWINGNVFMTEDLQCYRFGRWGELILLPGITINASNIVFDCNGHYIDGHVPSPYDGIAIPENITNVTIRNCSIQNFNNNMVLNGSRNRIIGTESYSGGFSSRAFLVRGNDNVLENVTSVGGGKVFIYGNSTAIRRSVLEIRFGGFYISSLSENNTFTDVIIITHELSEVMTLGQVDSSNSVFRNFTIGDSGPFGLRGCNNTFEGFTLTNIYGPALVHNPWIRNCSNTIVDGSITGFGIVVTNDNGTIKLVNTNYKNESSPGSYSALVRQWRFPVTVLDRAGDPLASAKITLNNKTGKPSGWNTTPADGYAIITATEYMNVSGRTFFFDPHNITVSRTCYKTFRTQMNATRNKALTAVLDSGLVGDANGDGRVDVFDLVIVGLAYGSSSGGAGWNPAADINEDGSVGMGDFGELAGNYGVVC